MKNRLLILAALALTGSWATSQDDQNAPDSRLPQSKQAMLAMDVSLEKVMENKVYGPLLIESGLLKEIGPPLKTYSNISRVTVFVGIPNTRFGEPDFIVRIKATEESAIPNLTRIMYGGAPRETRQEDGWTVAK
ncbi:MAG: hypothetical protein VX438_05060, partial [Planctomycetota bacterium]|nr:hypothetical protein [Planctomycetota bacterium]